MGEIWNRYGQVLIAAAGSLPVLVALVLVLGRLYPDPGGKRRALAEVGAVAGTVPWLWMTLTPDVEGTRRLDLIPLHDLFTLAPQAAVIQIGGNLAVFAAAGLALPVRFAALASLPRILVLAAMGSVTIELAQWVFQLGRVTSVDDVLLNAGGAVLAAAASRRWWAVQPEVPEMDAR